MKVSLKRWALRWRRTVARQSRKRAKLLAACGALALATAWTEPAGATTVHLTVTPTVAIDQAYVVYFHNNSSSGIGFALGSLLAGQVNTFDTDFPDLPLAAFGGSFPGYEVMGVYQQTGVSLGFTNDLAITMGATWDSLLKPLEGASEPVFIQELNTSGVDTFIGWSTTVGSGLARLGLKIKMAYGTQATMVNFSTATFGGTALATLPEPSTWVLMVTGAGVVALLARKRPA